MTQPAVPKPVMTFESIQYLRGLAALMVVVYHIKPRLDHMGYAGDWPGWLSCGVDIFFVISGFIMWTTTCDRSMRSADFFARRFLRIAPLYYLVTIVVIVVTLVAPSLISSGRFDIVHAIASFAFFPHLNAVTGAFEPVLPQGWTLNYEMEFYALFALGLFVSRPLRQVLVLVVLLAIAVCGLAATKMTVFAFYTDSIILEFGFGIVIAIAVANGLRLPFMVALACLVLGGAAIIFTWPIVVGGVPRVWLSGVGAALMVLGAVTCEVEKGLARHRLPLLLGDASYSIYLTHGLVLTSIAFIWSRSPLAHEPGFLALFSIMAVVGASVGGIVVYLLAERPLHEFARARTTRRRAVRASTSDNALGTTEPSSVI